MPYLPTELITHILSFLKNETLSPYAAINKQWQSIVESKTFSTLCFKSSQLPDVQQILTPQRRQHIRCLEFYVQLPEYDQAARAVVENDDDRARNNTAFTHALHALFDILHLWPRRQGTGISLHLLAESPSDFNAEPDIKKRRARRYQSRLHIGTDLLAWRYEQSYLHLTEDVPSVDAITELNIYNQGFGERCAAAYRKIAPGAVCHIVSKLPFLSSVDASLSDDERKDQTLRDGLRGDFAAGLATWPQSIRHLTLNYPGHPPEDGTFPPLHRSKPGKDGLSMALHSLSQQLVTLTLERIMIAPELFWPMHPDAPPPYWPRLTLFEMSYTAATPSGDWLFENDPRCPEYIPDTEDPALCLDEPMLPAAQDYWPWEFRTKPINALLNGLYHVAGRAARCMPVLETMVLDSEPQTGVPTDVDIHGPKHWFRYERKGGVGEIVWAGTAEFRPSAEVLDVWENVSASHGGRLEVMNAGFSDCPRPDMFDFVMASEKDKAFHGFYLW